MPSMTRLNALSYLGTAPRLAGPPRHAGPSHALVGRITLGRDAWLGAGALIRADGHEVRGGDDLHMGRGATVHIAQDLYPTMIGDRVSVGANAVIHACTVRDDNVIEEDVVILDGSVVEPGSVIEAGAVVYPRSQLAGGWLYAGRPAKAVRELRRGELQERRALLRAATKPPTRTGRSAAMSRLCSTRPPSSPTPRGWPAASAPPRRRASGTHAGSTPAGARIVIGARSNVQDNSVLIAAGGGIRIGADTTIGHNVELAACTIGERCLIGIGSRVAPGTVAEDEVFLAAGAVTTPGQVLTGGALWGGQPARKLADLDQRKRALVLETIATYCDYAAELARVQAQAARQDA